MTRVEKKEDELRYAKFFLSKFNLMGKCNYIAIPNNDELIHDLEVDVYAKSSICEELRLQVKIIDKEYMSGFVQRAKEAQQSLDGYSEVHVRNLDVVEWAKKTIAECLKKYKEGVRKKMILLLCVYHGGELNQEYAKREFAEYQQSDFKGIYLIDPPYIPPQDSGIEEYQGQLTTIKPIYH